MKKNILTAALVIISGFVFAQENGNRSSWVNSPVKIDGLATEWSTPLRYYDGDARMFFAFANDSKNIYLCFQTDDNMQQRKIMRAGMKITLSSKANGKHKASITFPMSSKTNTREQDADEMKQGPGHYQMQNSFFVQHTVMEVKGFLTREGVISTIDSSGINVALNLDESRRLTYEIAIPLKEFFGEGYTVADIQKDISLDAEINSIPSSGSYGGNTGYQGHGGSGRQGGGAGRMRSGAGNYSRSNNTGTGAGNNMSTPAKSKLKQKFTLATGNDPGKQ